MLSEKEILRKRKSLGEMDETLAETFKALGDLTRLRIFYILSDHPKISITTIAKILQISTPLASLHIKALTHVHLLQKKRSGKNILPELNRQNPLVPKLLRSVIRCTEA